MFGSSSYETKTNTGIVSFDDDSMQNDEKVRLSEMIMERVRSWARSEKKIPKEWMD